MVSRSCFAYAFLKEDAASLEEGVRFAEQLPGAQLSSDAHHRDAQGVLKGPKVLAVQN